MNERLVITGMGAITPIGIGVEEYWTNLMNGACGIDFIKSIDTSELPIKVAGEADKFDPTDFMPRKKAREMDRFMQLAFSAAASAIADSGADVGNNRCGIAVGTALNGFGTITGTERKYNSSAIKKVTPRFLPMSLGNICASHIAIEYGIKGPSMTLNTACASGGDAISLAAMMLSAGMADMMVVAGGESAVNEILIQSLAAAMALSPSEDPKTACRPFDKSRDGFVIGEGGGSLVIETESHALKRGANIYAVLAGWGNNTDDYHPVAPKPDGEGEIACMQIALDTAGIKAEDIGYINAHGTATVKGDIVECEALNHLFDSDVKVSSTKAATGHMMGAGGITEVISCIKALETGKLPYTLNLSEKDPECNVNIVSAYEEISNLDYAMSNAFGFGGQNSSIIVGKYKG